MEKKLQNMHPKDYNLLLVQDLWQVCYLTKNLSEIIHTIKCIFACHHKKCETCEISYKVCDCFLEHTKFKDSLIEY